ncbi:MAG: radical SAM protein [Deltaproteobacteria bacterium]|nr:radical SAM protein [Deltaproteobacteria bacterium]
MNKRYLIIPIFLPFEGCENRCIYCNQRALHPNVNPPTMKLIKETVEKYISTFKGKRESAQIEVAFYGGTFTSIRIDKQEYLLNILREFILERKIDGIRFSTRPDKINSSTLNLYKEYGVTTIEIGAQSLKEEVLKAINRNHTTKDVVDAITLLKLNKFKTCIHLMFGLPYSTIDDDVFSIRETIRLKPDFVRIHPTLVLKGTELEILYKSGFYKPLSLDESARIIRFALSEFSKAGIKVIRVGLHNDENLISKDTFIAGPFHPSLRQIATKD